MKRSVTLVLCMCLTAVLLASCAGSGGGAPASGVSGGAAPSSSGAVSAASAPQAAAEPEFVIKFGLITEPNSFNVICAQNYADTVQEMSGGRIEVQVYPSAQLGDKVAMLEGLRNGTVEATDVSAVDLSSFNPRWSVFSFPYLFSDHAQVLQVMHDPAVEPMLTQDAEAVGFKVISWWDVGARSMINRLREVASPADLNGMRTRVMQDKWLARAIELMGASPVVMNMSECYTALQQGVLDAFENSPPLIADNKFNEVAKFYSATEHFRIPAAIFMSKSFFDKLPADLQQVVIEAGIASEKFNAELYASHEAKSLQTMLDSGVTVTEVDREQFKAAVEPMYDEFFAESAPDAKELYDAFLNAM